MIHALVPPSCPREEGALPPPGRWWQQILRRWRRRTVTLKRWAHVPAFVLWATHQVHGTPMTDALNRAGMAGVARWTAAIGHDLAPLTLGVDLIRLHAPHDRWLALSDAWVNQWFVISLIVWGGAMLADAVLEVVLRPALDDDLRSWVRRSEACGLKNRAIVRFYAEWKEFQQETVRSHGFHR